jgi:predicted enzyme related to lactoylglutathione lyase
MRYPIIFVLTLTGALASPHGFVPASSATVADQSAVAEAEAGEFVWHDLVTDQPALCRAFYEGLFGWTFERGQGVDPDYTLIKLGDRPIGGMVTRRAGQTGSGGQWVSYVMVRDVDQVAATFGKSGGQVIRGPLDARNGLRVAAVQDAQGAILGLANRGPRFATVGTTPMHGWLWMEYVARDPDPALQFYASALGYRYEVSDKRENFTYYLLSTSQRPRAGLFRTLWEREQSAWVPYVRVADPSTMVERVVKLGGTVVIPPLPRVRNGSLALILDPSGAPLAMQMFPFKQSANP